MAGDIYFNGSALTGQHDVKLNGTDMDNVYLNGTKIWTRHPYAIGTEIFTYSGGTVSGLTRVSGGGSLSIAGSGNNGHSFKVTYSGQ